MIFSLELNRAKTKMPIAATGHAFGVENVGRLARLQHCNLAELP
jgi:hypothetical protein